MNKTWYDIVFAFVIGLVVGIILTNYGLIMLGII